MLKGDLRKKQILETAERLFCEKGYEKTGVQDILDLLHLSKGSFYHHYDSKERLLTAMCENRADAAALRLSEQPDRPEGIAGVEQVLSAVIPYNGEGLRFLTMVMPVFPLPEGRSIRAAYQGALKKAFQPLLADAIQSARETKDVFCDDPVFTAGICLDLINNLWCAVSEEMMLAEAEKREGADLAVLLNLAERYRTVLENVLTAPFGSLLLLKLEDLESVSRTIHDHWAVPAES